MWVKVRESFDQWGEGGSIKGSAVNQWEGRINGKYEKKGRTTGAEQQEEEGKFGFCLVLVNQN